MCNAAHQPRGGAGNGGPTADEADVGHLTVDSGIVVSRLSGNNQLSGAESQGADGQDHFYLYVCRDTGMYLEIQEWFAVDGNMQNHVVQAPRRTLRANRLPGTSCMWRAKWGTTRPVASWLEGA